MHGSRRARKAAVVVGLVCGMALCAVAPAGASASGPEFEPVRGPGNFPISLTGTSGPMVWEVPAIGSSIDCRSGTDVGELTGPTTDTDTLTLEECESPGFGSCQSGAEAGTIETNLLDSESAWIDEAEGRFGTKFTPAGATFAEFECGGGAIGMTWTGSVTGEITSPGLNEVTEEFTLVLAPGVGSQELVETVTAGGIPIGTFPMTLETTEVMSLEEEGEFVG